MPLEKSPFLCTPPYFDMHEKNHQINTSVVRKEALCIQGENTGCKKVSVMQIIKKIGLTHHISIHMAQKDKNQRDSVVESNHFITMVRWKVMGMAPDDVMNMDQMPIPSLYHLS